MCDLCLGELPLRVVRQRDISNPCCIRLVTKPPHWEERGAEHLSTFDASASRVFEGAWMSSDAEIFVISQCEFEALVHLQSELIICWMTDGGCLLLGQ